jgi:hypothetical protein
MNRISATWKKVALFVWAAAILWIYIGSLVNFHQHKIWGRPLLPQLLFAKRDKEKHLGTLTFKITFQKISGNDFQAPASSQGKTVPELYPSDAGQPLTAAVLPLATYGSGPSPLRGPPLA